MMCGDTCENKRIGVLGGSFDPVHMGHISLARDALAQASLDKVYFMPAKIQPFKQHLNVTDERHRLAMVNLAVEDMDGAEVTTLEMESDSVSYTYISMAKLRNMTRARNIYLITGTDSFLRIDTWMEHERLLRDNGFIVGVRPGYKEDAVHEKKKEYEERYGSEVLVIDNERLDISSTYIRNNIDSEKVRTMVPKKSMDYILEHGLYIQETP